MTTSITWQPYLSCVTPPTAAQITATEARIGCNFPADIIPFFLQYAGQAPDPETVTFGHRTTPVGPLVLFVDDPADPNFTYSLAQALSVLGDAGFNPTSPLRFLPFADNTAHGLFCFDLAESALPIVFVDLDYAPDDPGGIHPVAPSFTAFLAKLR
jgi:hypothetical protein